MMEVDQKPNNEILRIDGRRPLELRRIRVRLGLFHQADGSAYIEQGKTKVLATVYGPHQPKSNMPRINCQYSTALFAFGASERRKKPRGDRKSQERAFELRHAIEAIVNPDTILNSQIDIFVEVIQVDGSEFCVAVNAVTLALIDAGIPIKDYAVGCSVTLTESAGEATNSQGAGLLDANYIEECSRGATISIVAFPGYISESSTNPIIIAQGSGQRLHISQLEPMKMRAVKGCVDIKTILDQATRGHMLTYSVFSTIE